MDGGSSMKNYFPFMFAVISVAAIGGFILYHGFLTYLKLNHSEKWKELGSPTLFVNNSMKTNLIIFSFLKNKEYLKMNDFSLIKISRRLWNYGIIYSLFFAALLVLFAINLGGNK
jgi:hypothetical protein